MEWAVWAAWTTKPYQVKVSKDPSACAGGSFFLLPLNHRPTIVLVIENEGDDEDENDLVVALPRQVLARDPAC